jgi:hypothetical protein
MIENKMGLGLDQRNNDYKCYDNRNDLKNSRLKVLFLTSWYPNKDNLMSGIFIKRHAQAVSKYCDVCVLYIHGNQHRKKASVEFSIEDSIKTIRVYYKKSSFTKRTVKDVSNHSLNCIRGLKTVRKEFGKPDIMTDTDFIHLSIKFFDIDAAIPIYLILPMAMMGIAFSLVPAVMWPSVAIIVDSSKLGTAYGLMTMIQNIGLFGFNLMIGFANDYSGASASNPGGYNLVMWIFSILGFLGLFFAFLLRKSETGPHAHGLEDGMKK